MAEERTAQGFSKLVFGTLQPCAFINQVHIINDLTQASLEHTIVAEFAVVPAFNEPQPNAGDWAGVVIAIPTTGPYWTITSGPSSILFLQMRPTRTAIRHSPISSPAPSPCER